MASLIFFLPHPISWTVPPWLVDPFNEAWQVRFLPTLCPQCGAGLEGAADCQVMTCESLPYCLVFW
jgi:hypothetical protein